MRLITTRAERRMPSSVVVAPIAIALMAAISMSSPALAGKADNSLIVGAAIDFQQPDPAHNPLGTDTQYLYNIHDRLVGFDPVSLDPVPMLATGWEWSDDLLTLTLTLREGVKFHDGEDFNAEAVKTSLQYFIDSDVNQEADVITNIEVIDDFTIALSTEKPIGSMVGMLAERSGMIISPKSIAEHGAGPIGFDVAGTGPFKLAGHETGSRVLMERFEDYWDQSQPWVEKLEVSIFGNSTSAVSAMVTGQIDYLSNVDPINIPALEANPNIRVSTEPMMAYGLINIHTGLEPTDDPRVRQAMLMSIDRDAMALAVYGPSVDTGPAMLPTPPGYWTATPELQDSHPYDPEAAKALLAEAGYPDGVEFSMCINAPYGMPEPAIKIADIMREQMKPAGFTINVTEAASNGVCATMISREHSVNAFLASWSGRIDPVETYMLVLGSASYYNSNHTVYGEADELIAQLQSTFDREEQKPIFDKLNQIWVDYLPMIPLYRFSNVVAYNAALTGGKPNLLGRPYWRVLHY